MASASKGIIHSLLCCKFTWRIYALSERLLVVVVVVVISVCDQSKRDEMRSGQTSWDEMRWDEVMLDSWSERSFRRSDHLLPIWLLLLLALHSGQNWKAMSYATVCFIFARYSNYINDRYGGRCAYCCVAQSLSYISARFNRHRAVFDRVILIFHIVILYVTFHNVSLQLSLICTKWIVDTSVGLCIFWHKDKTKFTVNSFFIILLKFCTKCRLTFNWSLPWQVFKCLLTCTYYFHRNVSERRVLYRCHKLHARFS